MFREAGGAYKELKLNFSNQEKALGKLLCLMVKEVEQAYNAIPQESTPN